jgi:hypothetical protein
VCTGTALPVFRRAALCTTCFAREVRAVLVSADTATVLPGALRASPFTGTLRCYLACRSTMARGCPPVGPCWVPCVARIVRRRSDCRAPLARKGQVGMSWKTGAGPEGW